MVRKASMTISTIIPAIVVILQYIPVNFHGKIIP